MNLGKLYTITVFANCDENKLDEVPKGEGFIFSVPKTIDADFFFIDKGIPNKVGTMVISKLLVEALSANIHQAHQNKVYDSATHFREVIDNLEQLFVGNCKINMGSIDGIDFFEKRE